MGTSAAGSEVAAIPPAGTLALLAAGGLDACRTLRGARVYEADAGAEVLFSRPAPTPRGTRRTLPSPGMKYPEVSCFKRMFRHLFVPSFLSSSRLRPHPRARSGRAACA